MQLLVPSSQVVHRSGATATGTATSGFLQSFIKLVATLRSTNTTCTVIEQGCGGLISSSILMQPGASQCYVGGSTIYNTNKCQPLWLSQTSLSLPNQNVLLNSNQPPSSFPIASLSQLFQDQLPLSSAVRKNILPIDDSNNIILDKDDEEIHNYIQSKILWTTQMAIQYCTALQADYAIAEGGAMGPTYRPKNLKYGFSVIAIAGRRQKKGTIPNDSNGSSDVDGADVSILRQEVVFASSTSNTRIQNMYTFAQTAANICHEVVLDQYKMNDESTTSKTTSSSSSSSSSFLSEIVPEALDDVVPVDKSSPIIISSKFDRAGHIRSNSTLLNELLHISDTTKFVLLYKKQMLIHNHHASDDESVRVAYIHRDEVQNYFQSSNIPPLSALSMEDISFLGTLKQNAERAVENNETSTTTSPLAGNDDDDDTTAAIFSIDVSTLFRKNITPSITKDQNEKLQEEFLHTITKSNEYSFVDTRSTLPLLVQCDYEVVLYGTALMEWKRKNLYCSTCGSSNISYKENGGIVGQCLSCNTKFWPRQDPSMIVLIVSYDKKRVLLANHVRHQHKKIYTTLAGFVEVGETMESAVVREVYEETGIRVDTTIPMQYIGTQPWPFPQSCMIGFIAIADDRNQTINIDPIEIYDAKWFTKDEIRMATSVHGSTLQTQVTEQAFQENPNLSCVIPPKGVIARRLIDTWLEEEEEKEVEVGPTDDTVSSKFLHEEITSTFTTKSVRPEAASMVHQVRII